MIQIDEHIFQLGWNHQLVSLRRRWVFNQNRSKNQFPWNFSDLSEVFFEVIRSEGEAEAAKMISEAFWHWARENVVKSMTPEKMRHFF